MINMVQSESGDRINLRKRVIKMIWPVDIKESEICVHMFQGARNIFSDRLSEDYLNWLIKQLGYKGLNVTRQMILQPSDKADEHFCKGRYRLVVIVVDSNEEGADQERFLHQVAADFRLALNNGLKDMIYLYRAVILIGEGNTLELKIEQVRSCGVMCM